MQRTQATRPSLRLGFVGALRLKNLAPDIAQRAKAGIICKAIIISYIVLRRGVFLGDSAVYVKSKESTS
jgi:hypothetical protein